MSTLLRSMSTSQHRGLNLYAEYESLGINDTVSGRQLCYQHSPSLAESTMSRYGGSSGTNDPQRFNNKIETRTHPSTGLQHPYNKARDSLNRFTIIFQG